MSLSRCYSVLRWRKPTRLSYNFQMNTSFKYDNYLILDFESTCDKNVIVEKQEIIEFPCIWMDSNLNILSTFHRYVKPIYTPKISQFCTELTGINQAMVDKEETFESVLSKFLLWYKEVENSVGKHQSKILITCGDWDLKVMMPDQCRHSNITVPPSMTQWLNLKQVFNEVTGYYPKSLKDMCQYLNIGFIGRQHSGIDDCKTIVEIFKILKIKQEEGQPLLQKS